MVEVLILLLLLSFGRQLKTGSNCENELLSRSQHANVFHLLTNLWSLWTTGSRLEKEVGSFRFLQGVLFLWVTESLIDTAVSPKIDGCAVGFSGVLIGLSVWELCLFGWDQSQMTVILAALITLQGVHYGHLYGFLSGLLWCFIAPSA